MSVEIPGKNLFMRLFPGIVFLVLIIGYAAGCRAVDEEPVEQPADPATLEQIALDVPEGFLQTTTIGSGQAREVAMDPTGRWLIVHSSAGVYLYDAQTWEPISFDGSGAQAEQFAVSDDGRFLALIYSLTGEIQLWDLAEAVPSLLFTWSGNQSTPLGLQFSAQEQFLAIASFQSIEFRRLDSGAAIQTLMPPDGGQFMDFSISADDQYLAATVARDGHVNQVWQWHLDTENGQVLFSEPDSVWLQAGEFAPRGEAYAALVSNGPRAAATGILLGTPGETDAARTLTLDSPIINQSWAFAPDGESVFTGHEDGSVRRYSVTSGEVIDVYTPQVESAVRDIQLTTAEQILVVHTNGMVAIWSLKTGELQHSFVAGEESHPQQALLDPDGDRLIRLLSTGKIQITDLHSEDGDVWLNEHMVGAVRDLAFTPDGRALATALTNNQVILWDVTTGTRNFNLPDHDGRVDTVAISPDGVRLATGVGQRIGPLSFDDTIRLFPMGDMTAAWQIGGDAKSVEGCTLFRNRVLFTPDGAHLLANSHNFNVEMFDARTGRLIREFQGHTGPILDLAISADGRLLATASQDGTLRLWDVAAAAEIRHWENINSGYLAVAFSPDQQTLLGVTFQAELFLWEIDGNSEQQLQGRMHVRSEVMFSPDGGMIVAGGGDQLLLWDPESGDLLGSLPGSGTIISADFTRDGRILAFGGEDGRIHLWEYGLQLRQ